MDSIGKYVIHRAAVTTGYAQVLFCHDPDLMVPVAVKVFDPSRLRGSAFGPAQLMERFLGEARLMASFDHPYIVPVKTLERTGTGTGIPYFVMPYLAAHLPFEIGKDQETDLSSPDRPRRLPLARTVTILRQLASALSALHRRGVVHRWVKPSNILLTGRENGAVRLADFSMAKLPDRDLPMPESWPWDTAYCAPEQRDNASTAGPQADVYSLGVLACRLMTGRLPEASGIVLPDDVPAALAELATRATDPDPLARPPHAGALLPLLESVVLPPREVTVTPARRPAATPG